MNKNRKVMFVFGTRPEAIKMAPLILEFKKNRHFDTFTCVVKQHKEAVRILSSFGLKPDMEVGIELSDRGIFSKNPVRKAIKAVKSAFGLFKFYRLLGKEKPDVLMVQGDTSTAFLMAFVAFHKKIKVGHVEAGLRTYNKHAPFPEEMNRQLVCRVADYHFAPTEDAKNNLLKEGIGEDRIFLVGNTVLDAVRLILEKKGENKKINGDFGEKFVLITAHRRESFGEGIIRICKAISELARKHPDINFVYPVHPNPNVRDVVYGKLSGIKNIRLIPPVEYEGFVHLMEKAYIILTDSGGIQEEVSMLGKPCLVMRDKTEREEAVKAGNAKLVGTDPEKIIKETEILLKGGEEFRSMSKKHTAFGDGHASEKIVSAVMEDYSDSK